MRVALVAFVLFVGLVPAAGYDLGPLQCGGAFGAVNVRFSPSLRSIDDLRKRLDLIAWSKSDYVDRYRSNTDVVTISSELRRAWMQRSVEYRGSRDIAVPYGSESAVGDVLTKAGIASKVEHAVGDCGGSDISYFWITKRDDIKLTELTSFIEFVRSGLLKLGTANSRISLTLSGKSISPIPPNFATVSYSVVADAASSRGSVQREWDMFDAVFSLVSETSDRYAISVFAENVKHAPKVSDGPPTKEFFRAKDDASQSEFVISAGLARRFARSSSDCEVSMLASSASNDGPFRCTAKWQ